ARARERADRRLDDSAPSAPAGIAAPPGLVEKPGTPLGLVDPDLDQARGRDVAALVAHVVRLAQPGGQRLVVFAQLGEHVGGLDILRIVIADALHAGDMTDRAQRRAADLANA